MDAEAKVETWPGLGKREAATLPVSEKSEELLLVDSARQGDRAAFARVYERYARMVHGLLLARVPREDVDDLVQDVFVLALRRLHSLRDAATLGAWLATIARNRANDFHRKGRRFFQFLDADSAESVSEDYEGAAKREARKAEGEAMAVLEVIKSLPEAYRETLILRLVEGMTGPEIAERTGLTHGSVRVNLHRGMQLLRERLSLECRGEQ